MDLPLLVDADTLHQHLSDDSLLIIDLSSEENYLKAHLPGAIHLPAQRLLSGQAPVPNKLPSTEQLQALCNDIGLTPETWVVAYDDQMGPLAGRLMWTLNIAGHQRCSVLNGQLPAWLQQQLPVETQPNSAQVSEYQMQLNDSLLADVTQIKAKLKQADFAIWDARSAAEYAGEKVINAKKGGHIPGASLFEWTDCLISADDLRVKPKEQLLQALAAQGITTDKEVVTHCQTHRRSGLTYLVARHLGFDNIRCYDGSWFEWGNLDDTPVEQ